MQLVPQKEMTAFWRLGPDQLLLHFFFRQVFISSKFQSDIIPAILFPFPQEKNLLVQKVSIVEKQKIAAEKEADEAMAQLENFVKEQGQMVSC